MFNLSDDEENYNELAISKDTVTDPKKYILKKFRRNFLIKQKAPRGCAAGRACSMFF